MTSANTLVAPQTSPADGNPVTSARGRKAEPTGGLAPFPRRPARLALPVVEALVDQIISGQLPVGSQLPSELTLCEIFGVSRITMREAVKSLEDKGLALARQGSGTTVTEEDNWLLLDPIVLAAAVRHDTQLTLLNQLVDMRAQLESPMAAQAARKASRTDIAEMAALLALLDSQVDEQASFLETDVAFHDRIMRASGNQLSRSIVRTVHAEARKNYRYSGDPTSAECRVSNDEHHAIFECIKNQDEAGAEQAMSQHILRAWERRRPNRPPD
ncbi:FadR family transcriptional regulator [Lentzea sp. NEAU-D13]|uniref:FadR family transcriptional regulator n=1 Tax=Lentzea alba TaxID=2714351 RepID=A0A7C9RUG7_9PSEU|nr:FadR family transcriptional regulator [Lentzea alba]